MGRLAIAAIVSIAIALAAARAHADDAGDAIAALPVLAELRTGATPVVVRGDLDPRRARAVLREVRGVHADVARRFVAAGDRERPPVTLCLFASDAAYTRFVTRVFGAGRSPLGFYQPDRRIAVANLARGIGNARHELVHPLLGDDFAGLPPWLNEGIAALYGSARVGRRTRFRVNYRLRDLQAAIRAGTLPTLDDLAGIHGGAFYGAEVATHYALARYLLLYLDRRGELEAFYREMRDAPGDVDRQRRLVRARVDERAFVAWAGRLRR